MLPCRGVAGIRQCSSDAVYAGCCAHVMLIKRWRRRRRRSGIARAVKSCWAITPGQSANGGLARPVRPRPERDRRHRRAAGAASLPRSGCAAGGRCSQRRSCACLRPQSAECMRRWTSSAGTRAAGAQARLPSRSTAAAGHPRICSMHAPGECAAHPKGTQLSG